MQECFSFKIPEFDSQVSVLVGSGLPATQSLEDWTPNDDFCATSIHIHIYIGTQAYNQTES